MRRAQDHFQEQVGEEWGLERGRTNDQQEKKKHLNSLDYKAKMEQAKIAAIQQQRAAMMQELRRIATTIDKGQRIGNDRYNAFCDRFIAEYGEQGRNIIGYMEQLEQSELEQFFDDFNEFDIGDD